MWVLHISLKGLIFFPFLNYFQLIPMLISPYVMHLSLWLAQLATASMDATSLVLSFLSGKPPGTCWAHLQCCLIFVFF
jgi:hypothetical protein